MNASSVSSNTPSSTLSTSALASALRELKAHCVEAETEFEAALRATPASSGPSARNLVHYLALRRHDLRNLQEALSIRGLSSLGRSEASVLATLDAVSAWLEGERDVPLAVQREIATSRERVASHASLLLGPRAADLPSRVMVTMPTEAATSPELLRELLEAGMDVARINAAHDDAATWRAIVHNLREAEAALGRRIRIEVELPGPKLRTGPMFATDPVLHWRLGRDPHGLRTRPARLRLRVEPCPADDDQIPIDRELLGHLRSGDEIRLIDLRGRRRELHVVEVHEREAIVVGHRSGVVRAGLPLEHWRNDQNLGGSRIENFAPTEDAVLLHAGERFELVLSDAPGHSGAPGTLARVSCPAKELFESARVGERILFDDGRIEGRMEAVDSGRILVEITRAAADGSKLRPGKGINVPDTELRGSALTPDDEAALEFAAEHADVIGASFVQHQRDIYALRRALDERGRHNMGIILKVETQAGFTRLPELLLAALACMPVGVMVARGDLGVEVGFERLAELQEEILWLAEAAHLPVVWATQVLESMAKTGLPSRAEVTDAAMSGRAECVMLNKGPHIVDTVRFLVDVLTRMQHHQSKKRSLLRSLAVSQAPG